MARTKFIAGNWKMNTSKASAVELSKAVASSAPANVQVGIAPPFVFIRRSRCLRLRLRACYWGRKDVYFEKNGAFTGEISVEMLKDLNVEFCLTGHSERRHVLKESSEIVARKAAAVYAGGLI